MALAAHVAAIREAFEEVGVLLADHAPAADLVAARSRLLADPGAFPAIADALDLRLRTDLLVPLSRWVTPSSMPRRFDARFFAAAFPEGAAVTLVGDEVSAQAWHRPLDALESMAAGGLGMWLPTSTTLMQLAHARSIEEIAARLAPGRLGEVVVEDVADDVVRIEMPAGGGVAGQPVNAYLVGRAAFVLVDPGDPTGEALDRAVEEARRAWRADRGGRADPRRSRPCGRGRGAGRAARDPGPGRAGRRAAPAVRDPRTGRWRGHRRRRRADAGRGDARPAAGSRRVRRRGGERRHRGRPRRRSRRAVDLRDRRTRLPGSGPWQYSVPWRRALAGYPATALAATADPTGSDDARFRSRLRPSSTCSVGA